MSTADLPAEYGPPAPSGEGPHVLGRMGVRTVENAATDARAAQLRSQGLSYRAIARRMGCAPSVAHVRVQRALRAIPAEAVEELRRVERERLDEMYRVAWKEMHTDHVLVQQGKIIRDDDGNPLIDQGGKLAAMDRLLRIADRRSRLEGLDQPTRIEAKVEHEHKTTLEAEIEKLFEQMRANDPVDSP